MATLLLFIGIREVANIKQIEKNVSSVNEQFAKNFECCAYYKRKKYRLKRRVTTSPRTEFAFNR